MALAWLGEDLSDPFAVATPVVTIVAVNYNGAGFIDEFAVSLAAATYPELRLVLVDNASSDGSRERLPSLFPSAEIIENARNVGLAPALNQALERCLDGRTNYVLFLNTDTAQAPDFIDRLVEAADDQTIVVPKVLSYYDHSRINTHAGGFDWRRGVFSGTHDGDPDGPATAARQEVETASFCCMLIPAFAFHDVGLLDERLCMYYEDTDFVARARAGSYRVLFEPSAIVFHREGGSSGGKESPFKHYYATRNRPYLLKKHTSPGRFRVFSAYFLTTRALKMALYFVTGRWRLLQTQFRAVRDYYQGRMGMTYGPEALAPRRRSPSESKAALAKPAN